MASAGACLAPSNLTNSSPSSWSIVADVAKIDDTSAAKFGLSDKASGALSQKLVASRRNFDSGWGISISGSMCGMAGKSDPKNDERSAEETERIREATLKKLIGTPPKPHKDMVGKTKKASQKKAQR